MPAVARKKVAKKAVRRSVKKTPKKVDKAVDAYSLSLLESLDTETTGLYLRHSDRPFMSTGCNTEGDTVCWEWRVDPITRRVSIPPQERQEIADHYEGKIIVFHNGKFDIRALSEIGFEIYFSMDDWLVEASPKFKGRVIRINALSYHDTQLMAHACSSGDDYQRLKSLAVRYLRFSDSDEKELANAVGVATRYCRSHKIEVSLGRSKKWVKDKNEYERSTEADYWLPKFVYDYIKYEEGKVPEELRYLKDVCRKYAVQDAERTILLAMFYFEMMGKLDVLESYEKERRLLQTVYKMETGGITYSPVKAKKKLKVLNEEYHAYADSAQHYMDKMLGKKANGKPNNLGSYIDLQNLLYDKLKLPKQTKVKKNKQGERVEGITTEAKAIEKLMEYTSRPKSGYFNKKATEFLSDLVISRKYEKGIEALESYHHFAVPSQTIQNIYSLFPSLNQSGTQTTRFSSSQPNGQNVSKVATIDFGGLELVGPRMRDIFVPPPGKIWYATDYSQLELRIFAFVSQEQNLIDALAAGWDFHEYVAVKLFNKPADKITKQERRIAKNVNFCIIFGGSPFKVNLTAGRDDAYEMFASQFPNVTDYMTEMIARARKDGYVRTVDGYRLDVPAKEPYKIVSYQVQGTAGRIIKNAMVKIDEQKLVDWEHSRMALQIHDEIINEFDKNHSSHKPSSIYAINQAMEQSGAEMGIYTPVSTEKIESDWGHGQEVIVTRTSIKPKPKKAA